MAQKINISPLALVSSDLPEYNVLLLGESGAGKSTFINSFALYLRNETWEEAQNHPLEVLIATKFVEQINDSEEIEIQEGNEDESELLKIGESGTMFCNSYLFKFDKYAIRLIDTPGFGSTVPEDSAKKIDSHEESVEKDKENVETIVKYLSNFSELNAIAVILKGNDTRFTPRFHYCLRSITNNLQESALNNLIFVVNFSTHTRFGVPSGLKNQLRKIIFGLSDDRLLTFDHKSFRYLLAKKHGVDYEDEEYETTVNKQSWQKSQKSCKQFQKLIEEISTQIKPYPNIDTISIIDARKYVATVEKVINSFLQVYEKNDKFLKYLKENSSSINQLLKCLPEIFYSIRVTRMDPPSTVCQSTKCYSKICCEGCRVPGTNFNRRLFCSAFDLFSGNCKECGCHVNNHERLFYKVEEVYASDLNDLSKTLALLQLQQINKQIESITLRIKQLDCEKMTMESAKEEFKDFLKNKPIFSEGLDNHHPIEHVATADVNRIRDKLYNLEIHGPEFKKACNIAFEDFENDVRQLANTERVIQILQNSNQSQDLNEKYQLTPNSFNNYYYFLAKC